MTALTVLTDEQVRLILENMSLDLLDGFRASLSGALHDYSNNAASIEDGTYQQPSRIHVYNSNTAATTLFMPSVCPTGIGVKIVTVSSPAPPRHMASDGAAPPAAIKPTGAVTLLSPDGRPTGFLHASALTAFRTALSSSCLFSRRRNVKVITAFGSGLQSYWHIRLALKMQGQTIRHVHIIARGFSDNARDILQRFLLVPPEIKALEGWTECRFAILTPTHRDFDTLRMEQLREADVVFCCTPSTEDLFEANTLTAKEARWKGRLIVAVGSYSPDMRELPKELLHQATGKQYGQGHGHLANNALDGGIIVVDTLEGVMKEAGEIIEAKISPTQLVELGELVKLPRPPDQDEDDEDGEAPTVAPSSEFERLDLRARSNADPGTAEEPTSNILARPHLGRPELTRPVSSGVMDGQKKTDRARAKWLRDGNVIYKSVGLGLMDLVVGNHMITVARELGVGTTIEGF